MQQHIHIYGITEYHNTVYCITLLSYLLYNGGYDVMH